MRADLGRDRTAAVERGEQGGAGFEIEADSGAEMKLAGGVFAGRNIYSAAAGFSAGIDGVLDAGRASSDLWPEAPKFLTLKTGWAESEVAAIKNKARV